MKQRTMSPVRTGFACLMFFASLFILNGCFTSSGDPTPGASKKTPEPTPIFTYSIGDNGNISFTNLSTDATSYEWDFGDQAYSQEMNPVHQYKTNGAFSVSLTATGDGGTKTISNTIAISNVQGAVTYNNTTQTDVTITINGQTQVVAPGESVTFTGAPGAPANGTAITFGATSDGTPIGLQLTFTINDTFETSGTITDLRIGDSFFYLKVKNTWAYPITTVYVNYGLPSQTVDYITIPNDGLTYGLGYYQNGEVPNVRFENGSQYWFSNIYPGIEVNSVAFLEVQ